MRTSTPIRLAASVMLCSIVVAACGQKPGVRVAGDELAAGQVQDGTVGDGTVTDTATPTDGATATDAGATTETTTTTTTDSTGEQTGGTQTGTTEGTAAGGQAAQGGGGAQVVGNDRTGAPEDKIVIGLHAPATGAAPLPTTSFNKAKDAYWQYLASQEQQVLGRSRVEVIFKDDKYDPNSAGQVCKELASVAFLVAGGGGTDQIQRCGQLASVGQFPYFSAGVTEQGLTNNQWYFAASMSYKQQGALLAQYVAKDPDGIQAPGADSTTGKVLGPGAKIGTIITDTPNFADALQGWEAGLKANGLSNIAVYKHTKGKGDWIGTVARDFQKKGVDVIYFLSAPTLFLDFANAADETYSYNPLYIGPGVSKGLNAVLNGGCKAPGFRDDNAVYLSPFPGIDTAPKFAPKFLEFSKSKGLPVDDIAYALWGTNEAYHKMFLKYGEVYGNDLERQTFRGFVEQQAGSIESSIYPTVTYQSLDGNPTGHFGANAASVLKSSCKDKQWKTLHANVSGF